MAVMRLVSGRLQVVCTALLVLATARVAVAASSPAPVRTAWRAPLR